MIAIVWIKAADRELVEATRIQSALEMITANSQLYKSIIQAVDAED